ncbi:unnamed protein product [Pleuronectes platessa]|uniref:Uncharacterized protein n=1 Tax=Pleuronectes platessa TaxID=8262 RepID=A0A9N7YDH1_PLEPL|nr:unnamed protein product [Pleuronectes platessa]
MLFRGWNPAPLSGLAVYVQRPGRRRSEGGTRRNPEEPGGTRRNREEPGGARRNQEEPGGTRRNQEEPGGARKNPVEPGGTRRPPAVTRGAKEDDSWLDTQLLSTRLHVFTNRVI